MTIPELFENRYGPRIRWAAGVVIVLGGLLNMGVFLRITGEFLVLVAGFDIAHLNRNILLMMSVLLVLGTIYTVVGGMLSVLVTDFLQFIVMSDGLIAVTILVLTKIGWSQLTQTVTDRCAAGGFNPFLNVEQGGWQFILLNALAALAGVLTWQTMISRLLAAKNAKTGQQIYARTSFFFVCRWLIPGIWGIAALAVLPAARSTRCRWTHSGKSLALRHAVVSEPVRARGLDGPAAGRHARRRHGEHVLLHAHLGQRDLQRHPGARCKNRWSEKRGLLWNRAIITLIGVFLLVFGLFYRIKGDAYSLSARDRHHLPGQHLDPADRLLLLEAGEQLGSDRRDHRRRRHSHRVPGNRAGARHGSTGQANRPQLLGDRRVCGTAARDDRRIALETREETWNRADGTACRRQEVKHDGGTSILVAADDGLRGLVLHDHRLCGDQGFGRHQGNVETAGR